jgi:hypothetical protein
LVKFLSLTEAQAIIYAKHMANTVKGDLPSECDFRIFYHWATEKSITRHMTTDSAMVVFAAWVNNNITKVYPSGFVPQKTLG